MKLARPGTVDVTVDGAASGSGWHYAGPLRGNLKASGFYVLRWLFTFEAANKTNDEDYRYHRKMIIVAELNYSILSCFSYI